MSQHPSTPPSHQSCFSHPFPTSAAHSFSTPPPRAQTPPPHSPSCIPLQQLCQGIIIINANTFLRYIWSTMSFFLDASTLEKIHVSHSLPPNREFTATTGKHQGLIMTKTQRRSFLEISCSTISSSEGIRVEGEGRGVSREEGGCFSTCFPPSMSPSQMYQPTD